jgi:hypothetical protein
MPNLNLRSITNHFQDVRLASLASWRQASEISPRDHGGPYVVLQEGYDPNDLKMTPDEFVLGRSGKWLSIRLFYKMPVPERRAEFIFGTAGEVMKLMSDLPSKVSVLGHSGDEPAGSSDPEGDEMAAAIRAGKAAPSGKKS